MARAVTTTWTAPTNHQSLVYHVNYSSPLTGQNSTSTSDTTLTLTGLHPYEEYTISVQAGNKGGLSVPVNGTVRMYSDSEFSLTYIIYQIMILSCNAAFITTSFSCLVLHFTVQHPLIGPLIVINNGFLGCVIP